MTTTVESTTAPAPAAGALAFDLKGAGVRELNRTLHAPADGGSCLVRNPGGKHSIAVGVNARIDVQVHGHAGYYAAGMNQGGSITIHGNAG
ncbi:protein glxC, partial [Arthrobacter deserti]|nr:protein glxC [Arthrobacter deserti]